MSLMEMIAALRFRLGNKKGIDADILREIQLAQKRLEDDPTLEFWFLLQLGTLVVPAGEALVVLPQSFIRGFDGLAPALVVGEGYVDLIRMEGEDARYEFGAAVGTPVAYTFIDNQLKLYPTPDNSYTIDFAFVQRAATLTDTEGSAVLTNSFTENAFNLLMNKAGITLSQALRDKEALSNFTNDYNAAFGEMLTRITQREDANFHNQRRKESGDALGR